MRSFWFYSSLCLVGAGLALVVPAHAGDQSSSSTPALAVDPEGDWLVAPPPGEPEVDLTRADCEPAGGFISLFVFGSRFRGNMFHFEDPGELLEFSMELCITTEETLWFSVFEYDESKEVEAFCRVTIDPESDNGDVVVTGAGLGCAFYSTGPLAEPVQLEAGVDYVLGVAWGEPPITYGRDVTSNPRSFSHGQILGSVSTSITGGPPVDPEDACVGWVPSSSGVWSMEICLALDPGACCPPDEICRDDLNLIDCLEAAGEFTAPLVWCADVEEDQGGEACPIFQGACCIGGGCQDRNRYACEDAGGEWAGEGTACSDEDACVPTGACCVECACQDPQTEAACLEGGGIYRGDATVCATLPIPCTFGACCTGTDCPFIDTYQHCIEEAGGSFAGFGTTCESNPCDPTGACCADECMDEMSAPQCAGEGGVYRGDWTACATLSPGCDLGACCVADQGCFDGVRGTICGDLGGTFRGEGTTCDSLESSCPGNCCSDIGCLEDWSPEACTEAPGGVFLGYDVSCGAVPDCDQVQGQICCLPSGTCVIVETEVVCVVALGGELDPKCSEQTCVAPLVGACCLEDEICAEVTSDACSQVGIYHGDGSQCETGLCLVPDEACAEIPGACCRADGSCDDVFGLGDCSEAEETFFPAVSCSSNPCQEATGACCVGETCSIATASACSGAEGDYQGDDTPCDKDTCAPATGACCVGETCSIETAAACSGAKGDYQGDDTPCDKATCTAATGACCVGETCSIETAADCSGAKGDYKGDDTPCDKATCTAATGACCVGETCSIETAAECTGAEGDYQGDDSACDPDPCEVISIIGSDPPSDSIDARQPSNLACTELFGWDSIDITYDGDASGVGASDFTISVDPADEPPPGIDSVQHPDANTVRLLLNARIPPSHWTVFTHDPSGTWTRLGYLPADVNSSKQSNSADVLDLIDFLNGVPPPLEIWQADVNRSGVANSADILGEIDLLNGADCFDLWSGKSLPE